MRQPLPWISGHDLIELATLTVLGPASWLLPERWWPGFSRLVSRLLNWLGHGEHRVKCGKLERALRGRDIGVSPGELRLRIRAGHWEERLQILRAYRPGGWLPRIRLEGVERIHAARAAGRGCVLWVSPFSYSDLLTKRALSDAGIELVHLSAFARSFEPNNCNPGKPTWFSRRMLSPLRTTIEDRYLSERIAISPDGSLGYLRQLERRLRANDVVSIRAGEAGQRVVSAPFLEGAIRLASGAVSLAAATGAQLLPVFTVKEGTAEFVVRVEEPLAVPRGRLEPATLEAVVVGYARILEAYALRYPQLWGGWYTMDLDEEAERRGAQQAAIG